MHGFDDCVRLIAAPHIGLIRGYDEDETGGGELLGRRTAQAAAARDQHRGGFQPALARRAEAGEVHLPGVDRFLIAGELVHGPGSATSEEPTEDQAGGQEDEDCRKDHPAALPRGLRR